MVQGILFLLLFLQQGTSGLAADTDSPVIIMNQAIGMEINQTDGNYRAMELFVAERNTGLYVKTDKVKRVDTSGKRQYMIVEKGEEEWRLHPHTYDENTGLLDFTDASMDWKAGEYSITVFIEGSQNSRKVFFRNMRDIRVLIVPINGNFNGTPSAALLGKEDTLEDFTRKVYPLGENDLEWKLYSGEPFRLTGENYNLNSPIGRFHVWNELKKLQSKEDPYDLVIGLVEKNMSLIPSNVNKSITGYTFGKPVSIVSLADKSPAVTIAHEIGHCFSLGDEYENGTLHLEANMPPFGMRGKNRNNLIETVEGNCPYRKGGAGDEKQGTGTRIEKEQYPYDVMSEQLITREMTSLMGLSGYEEEEYWSTSDIWKTMYEALLE